MDKQELIEELTNLISRHLEPQGYELVDMSYWRAGRSQYLRILVDRPSGGITMDECARINNEVGMILDEKNILLERYILEVSSPGLDRPLVNRNDFLRCTNRSAHFFLKEAVEGKIEIEGRIKEVKQDYLELEVKEKIIQIPFNKINKAKQIISSV